jgi:hypothetical protein
MYFQNRNLNGGKTPNPLLNLINSSPPAPSLQDTYSSRGTLSSLGGMGQPSYQSEAVLALGSPSTRAYWQTVPAVMAPKTVASNPWNPQPPAQIMSGELDMPGGREMVLNRLYERIARQGVRGNAPAPAFSRTFAQPAQPAGSGGGELSYFNYAAGGLTAGPGDGMSDGIMTTIAGRQRAALSPGEFVVPADVVSGIGNGDTSSGAKRLYAMMDSIRNGRTGKTAQPQRINPRLPA